MQIMPAPLVVATMAELALLSTAHQDFALVQPPAGFKRIKYPDSFKASLMQVANEGYEAFNLAHVGMDEVFLATLGIPDDMRFVVTILMEGTDREVQVNLPRCLASIERAADTCLRRSKEIVEKYESVQELIFEMGEGGMNTQSATEEEKAELEALKTNEQLKNKQLEEERAKAEVEEQKMKEQLEKREKIYEESLDEMPGSWGILAMKANERFWDFAAAAATSAARQVLVVENNFRAKEAKVKIPKRMSAQTKLVYSQDLMLHPEQLELGQKEFFDGDFVRNFDEDRSHLEAIRVFFDAAQENIKEPEVDPDLKARVEPFIKSVQETLNKVDFAEVLDPEDTDVPAIKAEMKALHTRALKFQTEASIILKAALQRTTPATVKAIKEAAGGDRKETEMAMRHAQAKYTTTAAIFANTQKEYRKTSQALMEANLVFKESLAKISRLDVSTASVRDILNMLTEVRLNTAYTIKSSFSIPRASNC